MRHLLVVAHETLLSPQLADAMHDEMVSGPTTFHLVVPASHSGQRANWTEAAVRTTAGDHLTEALLHLLGEGFPVTGEVGDASPVAAVGDVLLREGRHAFDAVIVSTLPHTFSRWLRLDAPSRIERSTGLPVRHVVAQTVGSS
jgi:hypothetical protein